MQYARVKAQQKGDTILVACPKCLEVQVLDHYLSVMPDGMVYPDFVCMRHDRRCDFMRAIKLDFSGK